MHRNCATPVPALLLLFVFLLQAGIPKAVAAGPDTTDYDHSTYAAAGLRYLSDNVYLGRKDSLKLPYLTPLLAFHHSSGVFANVGVSYVPVPGRDHVDLVTLEAGYDHDFGEHINAGIYGDYFSYSKQSNNIKSDQNTSLGVYLGYNSDIIDPQVEVNANFGTQTDYVVSVTLDHNFSLLQDQVTVTPTTGIFAGTEHYYEAYLKKVTVKKKSKMVASTATSNDFKIVDYECSLPVKYTCGHWLITAIPTYAIPVNPVTTVENGKTLQEPLSNSFFLTVEADFRLKLMHRGHQRVI